MRNVSMASVLFLIMTATACSSPNDPGPTPPRVAPPALVDSSAARRRIESLRSRFLLAPPSPVIASAPATGFELRDGRAHAILPATAKRGVWRPATVTLPLRASDPVRIEDDTSHTAVSFVLRGTMAAPIEVADGIALYASALDGLYDVVHRVHAEGTEDYVAFDHRPAKEELRYDVDVSGVAGLRLVSRTLEFLDDRGTPRLRVAPPYVVDAHGTRVEAELALEGCAFDDDPSAPWERTPTNPGASTCQVRVSWHLATYPALVDPGWTATGSMSTPRHTHTATELSSAKVLIAGGQGAGGAFLSSAELFDGKGTFAATGAMNGVRALHQAVLLKSGPSAGKILVAGGSNGSGLSTAELFDGTAWTKAGAMKAIRNTHTMTLLPSGQVLAAGGVNGGSLSSAEIFDGVAWTSTGAMTKTRYGAAATLLPSGMVLITGGYDGGSVSSAELFDGASKFTATSASMGSRRSSHTATLLPSGQVLIAGGFEGGGLSNSSAEIFDGIGKFTPTGAMTTPRGFHTATLLGSGMVLVAGGLGSVNSAELFDGTSKFTATLIFPRFRGHPESREDAQGVFNGKAQGSTEATDVHAGVQGGGCAPLQGR